MKVVENHMQDINPKKGVSPSHIPAQVASSAPSGKETRVVSGQEAELLQHLPPAYACPSSIPTQT